MASGKKRTAKDAGSKHAEEITRWADEVRAAALAGDLEAMQRRFGALSGTVKEAFPQPSWEEARNAEEALWLARAGHERDPKWRRILERYLGTGTALESYQPHPTEGPGMLAARIADGQARVPWYPPHWNVTEADFEAGEILITTIVHAFETGDRDVLDRLAAAQEHLANLPTTEGRKLAAYVESIEHFARWARLEEERTAFAVRRAQPGAVRDLGQIYWLARNGLAKRHDPAFEVLSPERLRRLLSSVDLVDDRKNALGKPKGGRGKKSAVGVAAVLAVEVGAFGASDVAAFAKVLTTARAKVRAAKK